MNGIDKRGKLKEEPFTYRSTKDGRVFISWHGRQIMILKGQAAEKFMAAMTGSDSQQAQLLMARVTVTLNTGTK